MKVVFELVKLYATKSGRCPKCGKRAIRTTTFSQTLNPFNKNTEGRPKTRKEIWEDLENERNTWMKLPVYHARCED